MYIVSVIRIMAALSGIIMIMLGSNQLKKQLYAML